MMYIIENMQGKPLMRQHCEAITQAYCMSQRGKTPCCVLVPNLQELCPPPQRNGSDRHTACTAASLASAYPFIQFYLPATSHFSLTHTVLNVLGGQLWTRYTHSQSSQWRVMLCVLRAVIYSYKSFGTATVFNKHPCMPSLSKLLTEYSYLFLHPNYKTVSQ